MTHMTPITPHVPPEHDLLLARFDEALAAKQRLADHLAMTSLRPDEAPASLVTVSSGPLVGRGIHVEHGGHALAFHVCATGRVALHVDSERRRTRTDPARDHLRVIGSPHCAWFGEGPDRDGRDADDDHRYQTRNSVERHMSKDALRDVRGRFAAMDPWAVEAVEAAEDGEWLVDPGDRLGDAWRLSRTAAVARHLAKAVGPDAGALIRALMRGRAELGLDDLMAIVRALKVERPGYVLQALSTTPFLWRLFDPDASLWRCALPHVRALSEGRPPMSVVTDMLADGTNVRGPFGALPGVVARSLSNCVADPYRVRAIGDQIVSFMAPRPSQAALAMDEVAAVADMVERLRTMTDDGSGDRTPAGDACVVHALMDASGRLRRMPDHMPDALASLRGSVAEIASLCGDEPDAQALSRTCRALAFPLRRRHEQLARIDAEWHDRVNGRLDELQGLRDAIAARLAADRDAVRQAAWFPHPSEGPVRVDGVVMTPLRSQDAYLGEGREMRHCIGSMAESGRLGRMVAFSVADAARPMYEVPERDRTGLALERVEDPATRSTAGIDVERDGSLRMRQHLGFRNGPAPARHVEAMRRLLSGLNAASHAREALARACERARPSGREEAFRSEDVLPRERDRLLKLLFVDVRHWLPRSEADLGAEAWWHSTRP